MSPQARRPYCPVCRQTYATAQNPAQHGITRAHLTYAGVRGREARGLAVVNTAWQQRLEKLAVPLLRAPSGWTAGFHNGAGRGRARAAGPTHGIWVRADVAAIIEDEKMLSPDYRELMIELLLAGQIETLDAARAAARIRPQTARDILRAAFPGRFIGPPALP